MHAAAEPVGSLPRRPPEMSARSVFTRRLVAASGLEKRGFCTWLFLPGMFFLDKNKWWGNGGLRAAPHEGVDLCFYRSVEGECRRLGPQTCIPSLAAGEVLAVMGDFLGKSIIVHHPAWGDDGRRVCTLYGHTEPLAGLSPGVRLAAGDTLARLAQSPHAGGPGPHLHISLALVDRRVPAGELTWARLSRGSAALFLDPLDLIMGTGPPSASIPRTGGRIRPPG